MSTLKRITIDMLKPGMFLHDICGSWLDHPFWRTAFLIEDGRDIARIKASGIREVWIDTARGIDVRDDVAAPPPPLRHHDDAELVAAPGSPPPRDVLAAELERAERILSDAERAVGEVLDAARMGKAFRADDLRPVVEEILASVMRHPCALVGLARLRNTDYDTSLHSVAVCGLLVSLGHQLGDSRDELIEIGLGGLFHDIGKLDIPLSILTKPGRLTDEEFAEMKAHPLRGASVLDAGNGISPIALDICMNHHEKPDGTGYPNRLAGDEISRHARMAAICDIYDATTADRCYRHGWNPAEAMRRMAGWAPGAIDERLFRAFVRTVGIYPTGSTVRLQSGRLAVVVDQSGGSLLHPLVNVFHASDNSRMLEPRRLDLSAPGASDAIVGLEDPRDWGIGDASAFWRTTPE
jgi:HD-GYP domain-containing protein (c-di-GMP phosphodiesterase class II)